MSCLTPLRLKTSVWRGRASTYTQAAPTRGWRCRWRLQSCSVGWEVLKSERGTADVWRAYLQHVRFWAEADTGGGKSRPRLIWPPALWNIQTCWSYGDFYTKVGVICSRSACQAKAFWFSGLHKNGAKFMGFSTPRWHSESRRINGPPRLK